METPEIYLERDNCGLYDKEEYIWMKATDTQMHRIIVKTHTHDFPSLDCKMIILIVTVIDKRSEIIIKEGDKEKVIGLSPGARFFIKEGSTFCFNGYVVFDRIKIPIKKDSNL